MTYAEDDDAEDAEKLEEYLATPGGGFVLVKRYVCRTRLFSCLFWKAYLSIKQPLTAHGPIHPRVSSRLFSCRIGEVLS